MVWPWRRSADPELPVAENWRPLLQTDRVRYADIALHTPDRRKRLRAYPTLQDALMGESSRLGAGLPNKHRADDQLAFMIAFYGARVVPALDVPERQAMHATMRDVVTHQARVGPAAFMPVLMAEPEAGIVAEAAIDYAELYPHVQDDPIAGPRKVAELLQVQGLANRGAIFGGLLSLGDPRVCEMIRPFRDGLSEGEVGNLSRTQTGLMWSATVEFLLEWLEDLNRTDELDLFGVAAAARRAPTASRGSCPTRTQASRSPCSSVWSTTCSGGARRSRNCRSLRCRAS